MPRASMCNACHVGGACKLHAGTRCKKGMPVRKRERCTKGMHARKRVRKPFAEASSRKKQAKLTSAQVFDKCALLGFFFLSRVKTARD